MGGYVSASTRAFVCACIHVVEDVSTTGFGVLCMDDFEVVCVCVFDGIRISWFEDMRTGLGLDFVEFEVVVCVGVRTGDFDAVSTRACMGVLEGACLYDFGDVYPVEFDEVELSISSAVLMITFVPAFTFGVTATLLKDLGLFSTTTTLLLVEVPTLLYEPRFLLTAAGSPK